MDVLDGSPLEPGPTGPPVTLHRRSFLTRAVGWAVAAVAAAPIVDACTRASGSSAATPSSAATGSTPSVTPASRPTWASLEARLGGRLIRPGSPAYPNARLGYDPRFDTVRPQGIVMAANASDVATSIAFARERGIAFAARCGGHSYGGYSVTDGLVIDVSPMSTVRAGPDGIATVGAGATLIHVAGGLAPAGVIVPGGTCGSVGISGLTMGGGQGVTGRRFGLTCDSLRGATVVTADGRRISCDGSTNADLFWALRGGGGGNFGVVTSFTFATHPLDRLTLFGLSWPWSEAPDVLDAWQAWAPSAPADLWSSCRVRWIPSTGVSVSIGGAWSGAPSALTRILDGFVADVGAAPTTRFAGTTPYLDAALSLAGCSGRSVSQCRLTTKSPNGVLPRQASLARSDFFDRPIASSVRNQLLSSIEARGEDRALSRQAGGILLDAWGGAIADVDPAATALPHRSASFLAQEFVTFQTALSDELIEANRAWLDRLWTALRPAVSGFAYVNYIDPALQDWQHAYYGDNLARLIRVKRAYDPDDAFTFAQSIPGSA
jgi:FAD binding domain/Berberine and berberine like